MSECGLPVTRWRMCNGPAGHEGDHGNPWYDPAELEENYDPEEHALYLGEDPFADTLWEARN